MQAVRAAFGAEFDAEFATLHAWQMPPALALTEPGSHLQQQR
jgi:hypothetical protein